MSKFTVIWSHIGDDAETRVDLVEVPGDLEPTFENIMHEAWLHAAVDFNLSQPGGFFDFKAFCEQTYSPHAIFAGHVLPMLVDGAAFPRAAPEQVVFEPGDLVRTGGTSGEVRDVEADSPVFRAIYGPYDDGDETIEDIVASAEKLFVKPERVSQHRADLMQAGARLQALKASIDVAVDWDHRYDPAILLLGQVAGVLESLLCALQLQAISEDKN